MKILVTGAHGFLGRHTARIFAKNGYVVKGIGHGSWLESEWRNWGLSAWLEADLTIESLRGFADEPHAVVHCVGGGSVGYAAAEPYLDFRNTVLSTASLLEYIRRYSPATRFVYPSSASVYGKAIEFPISEDSRIAPISSYGMHKRMAEELVLSYANRFGVPAAIIRFFSLYGPELRKQLLWDACRKFTGGDNSFGGTGEEVRDWLHVQDAAELLSLAIEHASTECPIVNGGSGSGLMVLEVLQHVSQSLSIDANPAFSEGKRPGDPDCYIADVNKGQKWGWTARKEWREGVSEYVSWWKREMLLKAETNR
jgi:UDP-glucose 4-epimerase